MRNLSSMQYRRADLSLKLYGSPGDAYNGVFEVPYPRSGVTLHVIASRGEGWDHVSVSVEGNRRTPNWYEMEFIKRMFFEADEVAMQLHVAVKDHYSHPRAEVLHIWRPLDGKIPLPPKEFV